MDKHLIDFEKMEWTNGSAGIRYKKFIDGDQQLRLVEFSDGFKEADWCLKGHAGIVMGGEFALDFNGRLEHFKKDDIIFIPSGEEDKHKAVLRKGEKVTLLLFEIIASAKVIEKHRT